MLEPSDKKPSIAIHLNVTGDVDNGASFVYVIYFAYALIDEQILNNSIGHNPRIDHFTIIISLS